MISRTRSHAAPRKPSQHQARPGQQGKNHAKPAQQQAKPGQTGKHHAQPAGIHGQTNPKRPANTSQTSATSPLPPNPATGNVKPNRPDDSSMAHRTTDRVTLSPEAADNKGNGLDANGNNWMGNAPGTGFNWQPNFDWLKK